MKRDILNSSPLESVESTRVFVVCLFVFNNLDHLALLFLNLPKIPWSVRYLMESKGMLIFIFIYIDSVEKEINQMS